MQNRLQPTMDTRIPLRPPCPDLARRAMAVELPSEEWEGPTLRELADRVEHQFGDAPALAGIFTLGFGRDEPLTPCDIHQVCDLLGLPAEDFGVDV